MRNKILLTPRQCKCSGRKRGDKLDSFLLHLLQRWESITSHRLDSLGVEVGLYIAEVFVLEADVALFREQYAWEVYLWLDVSANSVTDRDHLTFSNLSLIGRGFIDVTWSTISCPIRNASTLLLPGR